MGTVNKRKKKKKGEGVQLKPLIFADLIVMLIPGWRKD